MAPRENYKAVGTPPLELNQTSLKLHMPSSAKLDYNDICSGCSPVIYIINVRKMMNEESW